MTSRLFVPLATLLSCCLPLAAQEQADSPKPLTPNMIRLAVAVDARSKKPVDPLQASDFAFYDNAKQITPSSFRVVTGSQPVEVFLILDAINVRHDAIPYERQQLDDYLSANGGQLPQPTRLVIANDTGVQIQPKSTRDGLALRKILDATIVSKRFLRESGALPGEIERFEASLQVMAKLISYAEGQPGRKLMLWISPGWPYINRAAINTGDSERRRIFAEVQQYSNLLRQSGITLYQLQPLPDSVSELNYWKTYVKPVTKPLQAEEGDLGLQVLVKHSGGLVMNESSAINQFIQRAVADTRLYYEVSFPAARAEHPDEYHQIDVKIHQPGLAARTTEAYYVQP